MGNNYDMKVEKITLNKSVIKEVAELNIENPLKCIFLASTNDLLLFSNFSSSTPELLNAFVTLMPEILDEISAFIAAIALLDLRDDSTM